MIDRSDDDVVNDEDHEFGVREIQLSKDCISE